MIEDGRAYGIAIALKHILGLLESKRLLAQGERTKVLDAALGELDGITTLTPTARAEASKTIGALYLR